MKFGGLGRGNATHDEGANLDQSNEQAQSQGSASPPMRKGRSESRQFHEVESSGSETEDEDEVNEDDEDEQEKITVISLFDDAEFNSVPAMLDYVKKSHDFDLLSVQKRLALDFLGTVKLVNFVRSQVKEGRGRPLQLSTSSAFDDDRYLQPVLEDDALLYNLEDVLEHEDDQEQYLDTAIPARTDFEEGTPGYAKVIELQEALMRSQKEARSAHQRLELAEKALRSSHNVNVEKDSSSFPQHASSHQPKYIGNYDGPELHRTMIADKGRTESYRTFILGNPHLFKDKVVLDVGCGTSILSLFCADAGAKVVYAVDQSESIINKAREFVFVNHKQDTVKLIHGRIQDITLPIQQVDIIVSEWMGYCLLYEAMLDSVIYARDRYLKKNSGLMVPSHSTLHIAPFSHLEYINSKLDFWDNVYGYNMSAFKPDVLKDVDVDTNLSETHLLSPSYPFLTLDLYTAGINDLSFRHKSFSFTLAHDYTTEQLDGFAIWFDVTFSATPGTAPEGAKAPELLTLSTGPEHMPTHWRQGLCLIDRQGRKRESLHYGKGVRLDGEIAYEKEGEEMEGLDISIKWRAHGKQGEEEEEVVAVEEEGEQVWFLH